VAGKSSDKEKRRIRRGAEEVEAVVEACDHLVFALLGGVFGFQLATSGPLFDLTKGLPSHWLVQAGKTALGGAGWPAEAWIVVAVCTVVLIPVAALAYRRSESRAWRAPGR
jgi:hypothetical protein